MFCVGKFIFNFGLNSFLLGLISSNSVFVIDISFSAFCVFDQKLEFEFKEQPKNNKNKI